MRSDLKENREVEHTGRVDYLSVMISSSGYPFLLSLAGRLEGLSTAMEFLQSRAREDLLSRLKKGHFIHNLLVTGS